jgi:hypothetical protein
MDEWLNYVIALFPVGEIFASQIPAEIEKGNVIRILPGSDAHKRLSGTQSSSSIPFSVMSRGANDAEAVSVAYTAKEILSVVYDQPMGTGKIISMYAVGEPYYGFTDENNRINYICNYVANIE